MNIKSFFVRIAPRADFGFSCAIVVAGVNVARTWRAAPADALRDAAALAGIVAGVVIPQDVATSPLYNGSAITFTMEF